MTFYIIKTWSRKGGGIQKEYSTFGPPVQNSPFTDIFEKSFQFKIHKILLVFHNVRIDFIKSVTK